MTDNRIDELLALAALGELGPADESELDQALALDVAVRDELDADLSTAAALQRGAAEAPPVELRSSVLDMIVGIDQDPVTFNSASDVSSSTIEHIDAAAPVASLDAARERRSRRWQPLVAAAAIIGLVVAGSTLVDRGDDAPSYASITQADDATARTLDGVLVGDLRVVYSESADAFVLDGVNVEALTDEQIYQLWFVDGADVVSIGTFAPDESGRVTEQYDGLDPSGVVVGVTIEPAGGSGEPTLPIVASA